MSKAQNPQCPACGWKTLPIVYGRPTSEAQKRSDLIFGGCTVDELSPDLVCSNCDWSGQNWHIFAPLPPTIWILKDPEAQIAPLGLVAGRFDDVQEVFQFGQWYVVERPHQFQDWLAMVPDKVLTFTSPYSEQSRDFIAELRIGREVFEPSDLYGLGFQGLAGGPPKFDFNGRMEPHGR